MKRKKQLGVVAEGDPVAWQPFLFMGNVCCVLKNCTISLSPDSIGGVAIDLRSHTDIALSHISLTVHVSGTREDWERLIEQLRKQLAGTDSSGVPDSKDEGKA